MCSLDATTSDIECPCSGAADFAQFKVGEAPQVGESVVSLRFIFGASADGCFPYEAQSGGALELLAVTDTCIVGNVIRDGEATPFRFYADRNVCQR